MVVVPNPGPGAPAKIHISNVSLIKTHISGLGVGLGQSGLGNTATVYIMDSMLNGIYLWGIISAVALNICLIFIPRLH